MTNVKIFQKTTKKPIKNMSFTSQQRAIDFVKEFVGDVCGIDADELNANKMVGVCGNGYYAQFSK